MVICFISTKFGRKPAMLLMQVSMGVGYFCAITKSFKFFLVSVWTIHFGSSGLFQVCYLYLVEITGFEKRVFPSIKWLTFNSLIAQTFLIPYLLGKLTSVATIWLTAASLHQVSFFLAVFSFAQLLLLIHLPESPKWLLTNLKPKAAENLLNKMAEANGKEITVEVELAKGSSRVASDGAVVHEDVVRVRFGGLQRPVSLEKKDYSILKIFNMNLLPVSSARLVHSFSMVEGRGSDWLDHDVADASVYCVFMA